MYACNLILGKWLTISLSNSCYFKKKKKTHSLSTTGTPFSSKNRFKRCSSVCLWKIIGRNFIENSLNHWKFLTYNFWNFSFMVLYNAIFSWAVFWSCCSPAIDCCSISTIFFIWPAFFMQLASTAFFNVNEISCCCFKNPSCWCTFSIFVNGGSK